MIPLGLLLASLAAGESMLAEPPVTVRGSIDWISSGRAVKPTATPLNPSNRVLELPVGLAQTELRPNLKLENGHILALVLRPRMLTRVTWVQTGSRWQEAEGDASFSWIELYLTWRVSENVAMTYGRQNFQWGPGELTSPSNRFIQQSQLMRDPLFVVNSREMLRVNLSPSQVFSAVVLAELRDSDDQRRPDNPFRPRAQLKLEYGKNADYVGATVSSDSLGLVSFGEYAQIVLADALFLYVDASHQGWSEAYYPVTTPGAPLGTTTPVTTMARRHPKPPRVLFTNALAGLRYNFSSGEDVRVELLFNDAGYDRRDFRGALAAGRANPMLLPVITDPGFELLGDKILYASVRLPDLPPSKSLTLELRYAYSLADGSGLVFANMTANVLDALVAFVSLYGSHGPVYGEFSRLVRGAAVVGAVYTW